jgi:A/G-specific adenine glycosylase
MVKTLARPDVVAITGPAARRRLLTWMDAHRRALPWRQTRDPWSVLVAECMLQQTQVSRVVPRWQAFLEEIPTATVGASVPASRFVQLWDGLGYNRRALQLHACAVAVTGEHGGVLPDDLDALQALPGIGPYTARAVLAFAYERDVAVVDTNVARIVARAAAGRPCRAREAQALADALVPRGEGWRWNQGMLDLGALVCTKRSPKCDQCPLAPSCQWRQRGSVAPDPAEGTAFAGGRQSRFAGSDRQGRGALVSALRRGTVACEQVPSVMGWPDDPARAWAVVDSLRADGLVAVDDVRNIVRLA